MSIIPLDEAKLHLRVDHDFDDNDIQLKLNAAEQAAIEFIQRNVYATQEELDNATEDDRPMLANAMFKAGVMLILGDLYKNREDTYSSAVLVPQASQRILESLRINIGV